MSTVEERIKILNMIADGKITAEEGASLLAALRDSPRKSSTGAGTGDSRYLRVRVTSRETGKDKVNFSIPIGLVDVAARMGARFTTEIEGMALDEIMDAVRQGVRGKILDADDEEAGEHVEIYVE